MFRWVLTASLILTLIFLFSNPSQSYSEESPYKLPYPVGKAYEVTQGNFGALSHNAKYKEEYAFDFDLRDGNLVVASRAGRILKVKDNSNTGGDNEAFIKYANYIVIDHQDGTSALYLHLQYKSAMVKEGDWVEQGQEIAKADSTGYITGAHLHFQVQETPKYTWQWHTQSIKISFSDKDVLEKEPDGIPKEGKSYISDNGLPAPITPPPQVTCPREEKLNIGQLVYTTDNLNVRESPGTSSQVLKTVEKESLGVILEGPIEKEGYVWWKVQYPGVTGWSAENWLRSRIITQPIDCLPEAGLREFANQVKENLARRDVDFFVERANFQGIRCQEYREVWTGGPIRREEPEECRGKDPSTLIPSLPLGIYMSEGYPITKKELTDNLREFFNQSEPPQLYGIIYPEPFELSPEKAHVILAVIFPETKTRFALIFIVEKKENWKIEHILYLLGEFQGFGSKTFHFYPPPPTHIFYQVEELFPRPSGY